MTRYELGVCPVCKTNDFRPLADENEIKTELESLWEFHTRRLKPAAPLQQFFDRAIFSQSPPINIVECLACGTVMRNPRESAASIVNLYETEEPSEAAFASLFDEQRAFYEPRVRKLERFLGKPGRVLEVGSYIGGFLSAASTAGWSARGLDVNEHANEFARARGCSVEAGVIEDQTPGRHYDVVAIWNCFDQLPDPAGALTAAAQLLAPGGLIAIRVPNGACYALFKRRGLPLSLLAYNNLLAFPYRHGFTPASLKQMLADAGMEVVGLKGDTLVSTASEWTRPWAVTAERAVKKGMRIVLPTKYRPWFEIFARSPQAAGNG